MLSPSGIRSKREPSYNNGSNRSTRLTGFAPDCSRGPIWRPRLLADENVDLGLDAGVAAKVDGVDIVRVQDVSLRTLEDPHFAGAADEDGC